MQSYKYTKRDFKATVSVLAENCIFLSFLEVEFCKFPLFDWTDTFQVNLWLLIIIRNGDRSSQVHFLQNPKIVQTLFMSGWLFFVTMCIVCTFWLHCRLLSQNKVTKSVNHWHFSQSNLIKICKALSTQDIGQWAS